MLNKALLPRFLAYRVGAQPSRLNYKRRHNNYRKQKYRASANTTANFNLNLISIAARERRSSLWFRTAFFATGGILAAIWAMAAQQQDTTEAASFGGGGGSTGPTSTDINSRFRKFSKKTAGERLLNGESFVSSLVHVTGQLHETSEANLLEAFRLDKDTVITKEDFGIYMSLLSAKDNQFDEAFIKFNNNEVTRSEFKEILATCAPDYIANLSDASPVYATYFGDRHKLSCESFMKMRSAQNYSVLRQSFVHYANGGTEIPLQVFKRIVKACWKATMVPLVLKVNLSSTSEAGIVNETRFNIFLGILDKFVPLCRAIAKITRDGAPIARENFASTISASVGMAVSEGETRLLYNIFDKKKTGYIDNATYVKVSKKAAMVGMPLSLFHTLWVGQLSACVGASTVYPVDKVKTRLQSKIGKSEHGAIRTLINMAKSEGFFHLYKGMGTQLVGITPEKTVKLVVNDYIRRMFRYYNGGKDPTFYQDCLAGIGTGFVQVFITTPYETVKIRLQMQKGKSDKKGAIQIIRELGLRGVYTGFAATICRDIPFNAIFFSLFAGFKKLLADEDGEVGGLQILFSGAGAAGIAAAFDTPADTVKTRLQNGQVKYKGMWDCITQTYEKEGAYAFCKGMYTRVLVIMPLFAITFTSFELLKRVLAEKAE